MTSHCGIGTKEDVFVPYTDYNHAFDSYHIDASLLTKRKDVMRIRGTQTMCIPLLICKTSC